MLGVFVVLMLFNSVMICCCISSSEGFGFSCLVFEVSSGSESCPSCCGMVSFRWYSEVLFGGRDVVVILC